MLADPRSEALATRFAAQWLRLQDIEKVHPDALQFPDFHKQLADAMRRETELFFYTLVRENRSVLDLYTADYTFVNEALAQHYGIPGVTGPSSAASTYPDDRRRGLLGQASVLTLTSHANRTSPVLRGKWVMEVLLGTPPPPPPPGVPDLDKTAEAKEGRMLTTRERMEMHRVEPAVPLVPPVHGSDRPRARQLRRHRPVAHPRERRRARHARRVLRRHAGLEPGRAARGAAQASRCRCIRTFTANLMAYAFGRRVEYYDSPTMRRIANDAAASGYKCRRLHPGRREERRVPHEARAGSRREQRRQRDGNR